MVFATLELGNRVSSVLLPLWGMHLGVRMLAEHARRVKPASFPRQDTKHTKCNVLYRAASITKDESKALFKWYSFHDLHDLGN